MIQARSATRVDLAGGTLDCWPLFLFVGETSTINLGIDIFTEVDVAIRNDGCFQLNIEDLGWKASYANLDDLLKDTAPEALLLREVFRFHKPSRGLDVSTRSQSPVGGGLGGSSSLCISLMKALAEVEGWDWSAYEYIERAHNTEARILHGPTGTQDYVAPLLGGLNHVRYETSGLKITPLNFDTEVFNRHMSLVYTGRPHHSGINNWQVIKKAVEKDESTLNCLRKIADVSERLLRECESQNWDALPALMNEESEIRVQLSPGFSSPEIESLRLEAIDLGADAVKICGAGGGGCVLVWGPTEVHARISKVCEKSQFQHLKVKAVEAQKNAPSLTRNFPGI